MPSACLERLGNLDICCTNFTRRTPNPLSFTWGRFEAHLQHRSSIFSQKDRRWRVQRVATTIRGTEAVAALSWCLNGRRGQRRRISGRRHVIKRRRLPLREGCGEGSVKLYSQQTKATITTSYHTSLPTCSWLDA